MSAKMERAARLRKATGALALWSLVTLCRNRDFLILGLGRLYASNARASSGTSYAFRFFRSDG